LGFVCIPIGTIGTRRKEHALFKYFYCYFVGAFSTLRAI
jgi:hypothetical protein